jgi:uncharacterized protein YaaR (DUF327 family)
MAKIDFPGGLSSLFNPAAYTAVKTETKKANNKSSVRDTQRARFSKVLESTTQEAMEALPVQSASEEALQELLEDVHSSGDDLKNRPFPEEIKHYKQAVRNFLHYVVENGFALEDQSGIPQYLRPGFKGVRGSDEAKYRKPFTMVQVVDQKLEQLAAGIMAGQTTQLELLARIDEIAGILVDLLQ